MKRIALIAHTANSYGANRSLVELAQTLNSEGHIPHVFIPEEGPVQALLEQSSTPYSLTPIPLWASFPWELSEAWLKQAYGTLRWKVSRMKTLASLKKYARTLASLLTEQNIDLVWSNSVMTPLGALAAKECSRPHIWHLREFGDLDFGYRFDLGLTLTRRFIQKSGPTIAMSHAIAQHFKVNDTEHNPQHTIIYDGLFSEKTFPEEAPKTAQPFSFILAGALHAGKGQAEAIHALRIVKRTFPEVHLHLVGDGDMRELKYLSDNLGLKGNITFWGYQEDVFKILSQANAALMCSRNEGFGRVTVEYMAAGLPVIGYKSGATPEIIENRKTGLLYSGGYEELADNMLRLMKDPDLAHALAKDARQSARERFTFEKSTPQLLAFLEHCLT